MTQTAPEAAACPHCGTAVEGPIDVYCCGGCELAAQIIRGAGLERYYDEREAFAPRPEGRRFDAECLPVVQARDGTAEVVFALDGLRCASCTWVTERVLERTPGVVDAHVSYASGRATVRFDPGAAQVEGIVRRVAALGYRPRPAEDALRGDRDLLVRTGLAAFVAGNVMLLSASIYAGWWEGIAVEHAQLLRWTQLVLTTPAVLYSAVPFFRGAWAGLKAGLLHMDLPISIAVAALYLHGIGAVLWHADGYLDSLTMLIALLLGGRLLEARGRKRAGEAAAALAARLPTRARRRTEDGVEEVAVEELEVGDRVEVGAGEELPADGRIAEGQAMVQMAMITGEAAPVSLTAGDRVVAGAVVESGAVTLRVEATGAETVGAQMARQLQAATDRGSDPTAADKLAPWFVGLTLIIAALSFGIWTWLADAGVALQVMVAVLVTACPCALGLSGPLATAAGLGASARRGAVLRSGGALLQLAEIDTVAFDKTGTVTGGVPEVIAADDRVLRLAAGLERHSAHPIGRAIVHAATERQIPLPIGTEIREIAGLGIEGRIDGVLYRIRAGAPGQVVVERVLEPIEGELRQVGVEAVGAIVLRDRRRADAASAITALRALGPHAAVLSGDRPEVARQIAAEAGISDVQAGLSPDDKVAWIRARQAQGHRVLFVGDGLNDGPALAAADVGLAMGAGATSSVLVADGVIAHEGLGPVPAALRVAVAARDAVRRNVRRSVIYNVLAVSAAAVGLVNPLVAALLMPLSSAWVIAGALGVERRVRRAESTPIPEPQ
ncbi:MAG: cadmium-translocating P-type ATPase [Deltaproteobacteria bacterium]|nr:MAG: cadmium-translocating P-type ATPase [Deltaproteobacteria bacterium]